jgi:hypothetical protein
MKWGLLSDPFRRVSTLGKQAERWVFFFFASGEMMSFYAAAGNDKDLRWSG